MHCEGRSKLNRRPDSCESADARAALPQNCSRTKVLGCTKNENGTIVLMPSTDGAQSGFSGAQRPDEQRSGGTIAGTGQKSCRTCKNDSQEAQEHEARLFGTMYTPSYCTSNVPATPLAESGATQTS
jgi:hypothetical protein